jgi:chitinase
MPVGVYYQSWSEPWSSNPANLTLAKMESKITMVYISFAQAGCTYKAGQKTWAGTGLQFSMDFAVVAGAIKILTDRKVTVMISVGGASYPYPNTFTALEAESLWALVKDLGASGIDIDWEPANGSKDSPIFSQIISIYDSAKPAGLELSAACWSTGAFPVTSVSVYQGMNIQGLKEQGHKLSWINIMSYDAGPPQAYSAVAAYVAYSDIFDGPIYLGVEIGTQAWGGYLITDMDVQLAIETSNNHIFIWSYQKAPNGTPSIKDILDMNVSVAPVIAIPAPVTAVTTSSLVSCPNCKKNLSLNLTYTPASFM